MQQPHEAFFSFTVPPKPANSQLLSSIVTNLDTHFSLNSRSPSSSVSPSTGSANRPGTAGPFAFNIPPTTHTIQPASDNLANNHHHHHHHQPLANRPYSSSGLPLLPPSNNNPQTPASSSHAISQDLLNNHHPPSSIHSPSALPSPLPAPPPISNCPVTLHHSRPMTAPGAAWVGSHHHHLAGAALDFTSAHVGLFGQASPYSLQSSSTSLSASTLSKTDSADFPSTLRHPTLSTSSPGPSTAHPRPRLDPITQAPHPSSSASSEPESILQDYAVGQSTSPVRGPAALTHSTESTPDSPHSSDADHSQSLGYVHSMPPTNNLYQPLRPNTHSGTSTSFGHADRFAAQTLQPRPTTGYPQFYDPTPTYASSIPPQAQHYPPRPPIFPTHSSQIYATAAGQYSHGPGSLESHGHDRLYNFNILPGAPRKRARRRFDEVERLYDCNYPGCTKAYGTLNHLNAHISMQKHGPKRLPQEFKEIRKEWRARKKAEAEARTSALKQSPTTLLGPPAEYNVLSGEGPFRRPNVGLSNDSSPSGSSTSGSFAHTIRSPAVPGSFSAPPHAQHFALPEAHPEWYNAPAATIDEQPEYAPNAPHPSLLAHSFDDPRYAALSSSPSVVPPNAAHRPPGFLPSPSIVDHP